MSDIVAHDAETVNDTTAILADITDALRRVERLTRDIGDITAIVGDFRDARDAERALQDASASITNMFTGLIEREARSIVG